MSIASYIYYGEGGQTMKPKEFAMTNEYINYFDFVKTKNKNSIFSNPNVETLITEITGNEKIQKSSYGDEKQTEIAKIYMRMYFSLTVIHLCRGEILGVARQKALDTMDSLVKSKANTTNPIEKHFAEIEGKFHPEMAKINMDKDGKSKKRLNVNSSTAKNLEEAFSREFKQSLKNLNEMSQKNTLENTLGKSEAQKTFEDEKKRDKQTITPLDSTKQNNHQLLQQMLIQQIMNQRAA